MDRKAVTTLALREHACFHHKFFSLPGPGEVQFIIIIIIIIIIIP